MLALTPVPPANPPPAQVPPAPPSRPMSPMVTTNWVETLNVLIALLENDRADLRGHSSHVARLTRKLCERLSLGPHETNDIVAAAYLHDIGKHGNYHLTALNVAEYEGHRVAANKSFATPNRLMAGVNLMDSTMKALHHMYERWDGQGFPDGLSGKDIPLGARLLAITDTYADLTQNPRNPFRKTLRPSEANDVLAKYRGTVLDNNLVDVFKITIMGDDIKAKLLANRHTALIVDPDPEETTVLEMRMIEQGFEVKIARTADHAISMIQNGDFELIVCEIDLQPFDGLTLCAQAKALEKNKAASWVLVAARADREVINHGSELGVKDFMQKPVNAEIAVAKLKNIVEQGRTEQKAAGGGRGVSGSLTEMGLPEIVQILAQGRKSGALRIRNGSDSGEIHFIQGDIWNAMWGKFKGADAFYQMVRLTEGDFSLDPEFRSDNRVIQMSAEGLLLEGMRLLDESGNH
jgi:response regulator RpfG family c-di-GMP phosphodiesterase